MNGQESGPVLSIENIRISFGGVDAVRDFSLTVPSGTVVSLIGPNGAGKTTVLNAISGFVTCRTGVIRYGQTDITTKAPYARPRLGIGRTFQNLQLFNGLTVLENVVIGAHSRQRTGLPKAMLYWGPARSEDGRARTAAMTLLEQLNLGHLAGRPAGELSLAAQKRVAIARALAASPTLLLLDEPAAGIAAEEVTELAALIHNFAAQRGISVLLVEHHMELVMQASDHIVVMHEGMLLTEGDPDAIRAHPDVIAVYLGTAIEPDEEAALVD